MFSRLKAKTQRHLAASSRADETPDPDLSSASKVGSFSTFPCSPCSLVFPLGTNLGMHGGALLVDCLYHPGQLVNILISSEGRGDVQGDDAIGDRIDHRVLCE